VAQADIDNESLVLAKPLTYMNNSGLACKRLSAFYKVSPANILIVYDDADLKPGVLRFSKSGSGGGHRGFTSLIEIMATAQIKRLRVGIGKPCEADLSDYVLSDFDYGEMPVVTAVIERAGQACLEWVHSGIETAMQKYNRVEKE
jgi:PTH1 family peptidyl-tRNA hydrolase